MESCQSSADGCSSSSNSCSTTRHSDQLLKLNKQSHKISKGVRKSPLEQHQHHHQQQEEEASFNNNNNNNSNNRQQPQPPVYNINKNDFRNVVQRLTGSPAPQERFSVPPPIHPPKPASLRLQKIRPPPLAPINNSLQSVLPQSTINNAATTTTTTTTTTNDIGYPDLPFFERSTNWPFSPLPPLPRGNTADSPISAYLRGLQNPIAGSESKHLPVYPPLQQPSLLSPRSTSNPLPHPFQSPVSQFLLPSPSSFLQSSSACMPYPLLSPNFQYPHFMNSVFPFSPSSQLGLPLPPSPGFMFPLSPAGRLPVPSPKWRDL